MAQQFPDTHYSCPCAGVSQETPSTYKSTQAQKEADEDEETTFDPSSPRAVYSLYPLEYLLYCTECQQPRCERCITDEIICWYCPSCLFEVPSSTVRSEGNRCTRSCYNCPICTAPLIVNSIEPPTDEPLDAPGGPFILSCPYCDWSSLDVGLTFEKHNNITGQLQKMRNERRIAGANNALRDKNRYKSQAERLLISASDSAPPTPTDEVEEFAVGANVGDEVAPDCEDRFNFLQNFYKTQLAESGEGMGYGGSGMLDLNFNSPSSITRLLNLYGPAGKKTKRAKPKPMREALSVDEGLKIFDPREDELIIRRRWDQGLDATASIEQVLYQDRKRDDVRFVDDLMPVATLLRSKRLKRCRACRTLLSRPEPKVSSTRYKIKTLAMSFLPRVTMRSMSPSLSASTSQLSLSTSARAINPFSSSTNVAAAAAAGGGRRQQLPVILTPLQPHLFILTLTNPLFDPVRVTLATPTITPGPIASKVTILCPEFKIGRNMDVFEDALGGSSGGDLSATRDKALPTQTQSRNGPNRTGPMQDPSGEKVAEAGKIWDQARNWTSVVVEIIPGQSPNSPRYILPPSSQNSSSEKPKTRAELDEQSYREFGCVFDEEDFMDEEAEQKLARLREESRVRIPIFVRVEYEVETGVEDGVAGSAGSGSIGRHAGDVLYRAVAGGERERETREMAFWVVVDAGLIE